MTSTESHADPALADWASQTLLGNPSQWPMGEGTADLEAAKDFFSAEGIGPLCHYALQTAGAQEFLPKAIWNLLRQESHASAVLELVGSHQDTQVLQWLMEIGLNPIVLKGAAYARTIYPEAYLRPRCDTDLLLPDRASAQWAWRRLAEEGYELSADVVEGRFVSRQRTCVKPTCGGHALDTHWAISNTHTFVRALPYNEINQDAVSLPTLHESARTLGTVHSLLFACLHLFGHAQMDPTPRLLWLYDIFLLSRRMSNSDWQAFTCAAITKGVAGICRDALDGTNAKFPIAFFESIRPTLLEAEGCETFRPDRLRTPLGFALRDLKALDGWSAKLQWVRETLLPSPAYVRSKYPGANGTWLPLIYLHRTVTGLAKRLRLGRR
jgi:hypothetical protein